MQVKIHSLFNYISLILSGEKKKKTTLASWYLILDLAHSDSTPQCDKVTKYDKINVRCSRYATNIASNLECT